MHHHLVVKTAAALALFSSLMLSGGAAAAEEAKGQEGPSVIALWVREPGSTAASAGARRGNLRLFDLDREKLDDALRTDVQYGTQLRMRGVTLGSLINLYRAPLGVDLAILHFDNGVAIPLPFRDERELKRVDAFVARAVQTDAESPFTSEFPPILKQVDNYIDVRPVEFHGNKVAASSRYHPLVPERDTATFSPWMAAGSLRGIEFVQAAAWYRQLDVEPGSREVRDGMQVFQRTCQFCHGVGGLGARFGIDFLVPQPVTARKPTPRSLFFHVLLRDKGQPGGGGALMPALRHVSEEDVRRLHRFLAALPAHPIAPYQP